MSKAVPFIPNSDDLHCMQAAFMMILKYFKPEFEINWDEWSNLTGFEKDKGTWPIAGLVWFNEHGFEVKHIEDFNFEAFAKDGESYLKNRFPGEGGAWAIEHTNIAAEQARAKKLIKTNINENRNPSISDIKSYLDQGYLVRAHVNSRKLSGREGYFGHEVVVFGYDDSGFTVHDPGPPALRNRKIDFISFENAWIDAEDDAAEMDAIKLKT